MDLINNFIETAYLEAIGWTLIHSIWQIMVVSLILWAVLKLSPKKSAQFRYSAGLAALTLIILGCIWTFATVLETHTKNLESPSGLIVQEQLFSAQPETPATSPLSTRKGLLNQAWTYRLESYLPTLVNLWLLGALFFAVKLTGGLLDLRNLHRKHHQSAPAPLIQKVNSLVASMGFYRKVKVLKSHLIHVPITYGILKPVILIPTGLLLNTPPAQLEAIIAHELAHIKRYDYLINILQRILEVLFFFHPCFWWINEVIEKERENACDDMVLHLGFTPKDLAYGLAEVAEQAHNISPDIALAATGHQNPTLDRIKRILGMQSKEEKISPLITLTMLISLMISASLVMGAIPPTEKDLDSHYLTTNLKSKTIIKQWHFPCPDEEIDIDEDFSSNQEIAMEMEQEVEKIMFIKKGSPAKIKLSSLSNSSRQHPHIYHYPADTTPDKTGTRSTSPKTDPMPVLELSPVPVMDALVPPVPAVPPFDPAQFIPPHPEVQLDLAEEGMQIGQIAVKIAELAQDTSKQAEQQRKQLESQLKVLEQKMAKKTKAYEQQMEQWEKKHGEAMKEWEAKMEAWGKEMEKKQSEWETAYAPKMKEFEKKMEAWEKENEPKIKEFEAKMRAWEKRQKERSQEEPIEH
ncbi:hypothetical protein GCM10028791_29040 [Echinicola sediminis]